MPVSFLNVPYDFRMGGLAIAGMSHISHIQRRLAFLAAASGAAPPPVVWWVIGGAVLFSGVLVWWLLRALRATIRMRTALLSIEDLIFVYDREGRFTDFFQPPTMDALLLPPDSFLGKH